MTERYFERMGWPKGEFPGWLEWQNVMGLLGELRERGWTQARLAAALGVSVRTVGRWQAGERIPKLVYWPVVERLLLEAHQTAQEG